MRFLTVISTILIPCSLNLNINDVGNLSMIVQLASDNV